MGIGLNVRRLFTKDKVDPEPDREPWYVFDNPWRYGQPHRLVDDDPPYYVDKQGERHYVTDNRKRYRMDNHSHRWYYVDDDGKWQYEWMPPWGSNPS